MQAAAIARPVEIDERRQKTRERFAGASRRDQEHVLAGFGMFQKRELDVGAAVSHAARKFCEARRQQAFLLGQSWSSI